MSEKNIYVRVIAGIDIMTREARWEFQSLNPETGMMLATVKYFVASKVISF